MKKYMMLLMAALTISSVSIYAQEKAGKKDTTQHVALYSCPMHPDVKMDKPGKCPQCGMNLSLSKKEEMKKQVTKTYACPVHADVVSDKSGKCPQCGKKLTLSKKEEMKTETMKNYCCSMHPDMVSDKAGKCPKCGMEMTIRKDTTGKKSNK
jgi:transcription initiation factor IIE alpha subunit